VNVKYLLSGNFQDSVKAWGFQLVVLGSGRGEVPEVLRSRYLMLAANLSRVSIH
jgi:hypothetical protein